MPLLKEQANQYSPGVELSWLKVSAQVTAKSLPTTLDVPEGGSTTQRELLAPNPISHGDSSSLPGMLANVGFPCTQHEEPLG